MKKRGRLDDSIFSAVRGLGALEGAEALPVLIFCSDFQCISADVMLWISDFFSKRSLGHPAPVSLSFGIKIQTLS